MASDGLCQLTAFFIADISGRRSDQSGNGEFLHVFTHIDPDDIVFVIEQCFRKGLGQLGLADTGGTQEEERADRPVGILDAGTGPEDGFGYFRDRFILADDTFVQNVVQMQELFALALHQLGDRDAGPSGNDPGDLFIRHGVTKQGIGFVRLVFMRFRFFQFFFQGRQLPVFEFGCLVQVIIALRTLDLQADGLDLFTQFLHLPDGILFVLPAGLHFIELFPHFRKLFLYFGQMLFRQLVIFLFQRSFLDLMLHDLSGDLIQLRRHGIHFRLDHRAGFIDQVDGFIRQETVADVAVGEYCCGNERLVVDLHAVEYFVTLLQTTQDGNGIFDRRFLDHDGLETSLQRGILLDIFPVLIQRRGTDAVQFASCQHGL